MTKFSTALILTILISGGGYAALAATAPTEIAGPVCIKDAATIKMNTTPAKWCDGGKVVHLAGTSSPSISSSEGKIAVAALSRLIGGMPLRCQTADASQPVISARCWNEAGEDVGAQLRAEGYLH